MQRVFVELQEGNRNESRVKGSSHTYYAEFIYCDMSFEKSNIRFRDLKIELQEKITIYERLHREI